MNGAETTTYWSNDGSSTTGNEPTSAVTLSVSKGLYAVILGDATVTNMTVIPSNVFSNADVRLRIWFNDGANGSLLLTPDQRITAVGYAMVAAAVDDGTITTAKLVDGAVTTTKLSDGSVTAAKIAELPKVALSGQGTVPSGAFSANNPYSYGAQYDVGGFFNAAQNDHLTIPQSGTYLITANVVIPPGNGGTRACYITINGGTAATSELAPVLDGGNNTGTSISAQLKLNAGDVVTQTIYQDSSVAQSCFYTLQVAKLP